jgi:hypothetical protein
MGYRHFDALDAYLASSDSGDLSELIRRLDGEADPPGGEDVRDA